MAMSALEMIAFFGERAEDAAYGIVVAKKKQSVDLAVANVSEQFKCGLMQGLIQWRVKVESPRVALLKAVETFVSGVETILSMRGGADAITNLCFERAAIIGYLVGVTIDSPNLGQRSIDRKLDGMIAKWLYTGEIESDYERCLALLKHERLASQTYLTYAELMSSTDDISNVFASACRLFDERRRDSFFCGGDQTDGGDGDNSFTVDYRLAAICKKNSFTSESVHLWRW